ncbi:unnamed protein product [Ectocarpus sp. 12 AP-2014]
MLRIVTASTLALAIAAPSFAASPSTEEAADNVMSDPVIMDEKWDFSISDLDLLSSEPEGYKKIDPGTLAASDVMGQRVYDANKEWVGEVDNLVVTPQGEIIAAILGVGGYLGIGEKDVVVSYDTLMMTRNIEDDSLRIYAGVTKEQLKDLPDFDY